MDQNQRTRPTRRDFVRLALGASGSVAFAVGSGCRPIGARSASIASGSAPLEQGQELPPTPECVDDDDPTPAQTEGPYFTPSSPERASLVEPGLTGTKITLRGYVLTTDCQAAARALLDFWQADDSGEYDNIGYKLRGHQFADEAGRYSLESIVPGLYPGRTRHFHVKVQAPGQPALTTQLYFPSEPRNQSDGIFHPALLMDVQDAPDGSRLARFDFVLPTG